MPGPLRYHCPSPLQDIHRILALAAELPQTLSPALPPGTLLKEYSLLAVLGMGGFGITYLAADNYLHLKVAIKEYFPSGVAVRNQFTGAVALKSDEAQAEFSWGKDRFMREAQTLARFAHKNIVKVFRYFEGNGTCYMVMAYEDGQSMEQALAADPTRWDTQAMLAVLMPLLDGLESVHAAGFLHRDIKPANIVLRSSDGSPVLIDFGAARAPTSSEALTVVLSHGYGPPEQYSRQGHQGPWSDIYALGGVLYRIVTGSVPPVSLQRMQQDPIIPATFFGEGRFEPQFLKAIDQAMEVDETKRPQSIGEWRKMLVGDTTGFTTVATPPGVGGRQTSPAADRAGTLPSNPIRMDSAAGRKADHAAGLGQGRNVTSPSVRARTSERLEENSDTNLVGRIGRTMIAHPFLSLLVLVAALFAAQQFLRRPAKLPATPPVSAAVTDEPGAHARIAESGGTTDQPSASRGDRVPVPISGPAPTAEIPADGERLRNLRARAIASCEGKSIGAPCRVVTPRNEVIDATCMATAEGMSICRPARIGQRQPDLPGGAAQGPDALRQPAVPRPPR